MVSKRLQNGLKVAALVLGVLLLIVGLGLLMVFPIFVAREIAKQDHLGFNADGTDNLVLEKFRKPEYDILLQIWTFSVTNADQVIKESAKPIVEEKGPYTFVETQEKKFLKFIDNSTRVLYRNTRSYKFSSALSCLDCTLTNRVVVPNIVFQKLVDIASTKELYRFVIEEALKTAKESAFIGVSVGDLLFDGYEDPLVSSLCNHLILKSICKAAGVPSRIGLLYQQNNTDDGLYEVDSGVNSVYDLGKVYSWNNMTTLSKKYWYGEQARTINGTDGQLFRPNLLLTKNLELFVGQVCRSVEMEHNGFVSVAEIPSYQYVPAKSMNDVPSQRAKGFCNPATPMFFNDTHVQEVGCTPSGLLDISSCVPGNPRIYVSQSHFLNSPAELRAAIKGLKEPSADDATFVNIEPLSGAIVNAARRSQLNVGVTKGNLQAFAKMKDVIVPIVWMNETAMIDSDTRQQVLRPINAVHTTFVVGMVLISFGALFLVAFTAAVIYSRFFQKRNEPPQYDPLENDEVVIVENVNQLDPIVEENISPVPQ